MPRVPQDRKEMVQGVSYGSSEVSKDEGVGNHEGVQVGGDASFQAEEQECGVMVMKHRCRVGDKCEANRMKTTTKPKQIPP